MIGTSRLMTLDDEKIDEELYRPVVDLVDGLDLNELNQGTTFQIKTDSKSQDDSMSYFADEEIVKHVRLEGFDLGEDDDGPCVPGDIPFEKYEAKMKDVISGGGVKKKIIQAGVRDGRQVPDGALVTVQYNAYNEFIEEPFDSTYMRNGAQKYRLGEGFLLPGVELAIKSMCQNERSWFLIKPHLAFGKLGCPPRILPKATVLFDIHLIDYIDSGKAADFDSLTSEEQNNADFKDVLGAAQGHRRQGNDHVKNKNYVHGAQRYQRAVQILERCNTMKDDKDEIEMNHLLLTLYVNLGITYNLLKDPPKACIFTKKALSLDPNNVKALFNRGKAFLSLNEFSDARRFLLAAKRHLPHCIDINEALKMLEDKEKSYLLHEQQLCQRMFSRAANNILNNGKKEKTKVPAEITKEFQEIAEDDLKEFLNDDRKEPYTFPLGLTAAEIQFATKTAEKLGLRANLSDTGKLSIFKE